MSIVPRTTPPPVDSLAAVSSGMGIGALAMVILGIAPVVFGALTADGRLTAQSLGWVCTLEILMLAGGSGLGVLHLGRGRLRTKLVAAALLLATVDLAAAALHGLLALLADRSSAGLLEGYTLSAAILVMSRSRNPERLNGVFIGLAAVPQALCAWLLPAFGFPALGANAGLLALVVCALLAAMLAPALKLSSSGAVVGARPAKAGGLAWPALAVLGVAGLINCACGAAWCYVERLGAEHQLQGPQIGDAISISLICQLGGALGMGWIAGRLRLYTAALLLCLLLALVLMALPAGGSPLGFTCLVAMLGLIWQASAPLLVALLVRLDPARLAVMLLPPVTLLGLALGPASASLLVADGSVSRVFEAASALIAVAGLVVILSARRTTAANPHPVSP